jgi:hypothetical protein
MENSPAPARLVALRAAPVPEPLAQPKGDHDDHQQPPAGQQRTSYPVGKQGYDQAAVDQVGRKNDGQHTVQKVQSFAAELTPMPADTFFGCTESKSAFTTRPSTAIARFERGFPSPSRESDQHSL